MCRVECVGSTAGIQVVDARASFLADVLFLTLRRVAAERALEGIGKAVGWMMPGRMERARLALRVNYEREACENEEWAPTDWRGEG